jgi:hypothetical protein
MQLTLGNVYNTTNMPIYLFGCCFASKISVALEFWSEYDVPKLNKAM